MSSYFLSQPPHLSPEQRTAWNRRQYVAECAITFLANKAQPLDSAIIAHLQDFVAGSATLGQAIGRIVDHFAQQPQDFGTLQHH
ncbi:hypothetical protein [Hymenobacter arizonensis]|uniref:Antitoxin VbhA domain-containing protein n=1 Tax=Hymenobacter arizonensis TaxID=1227077 RepID=A0A1I5X306_HYMAR|nr:hypothetical protein [Hymenobacter arizonensis]SFQ26304.1 hypothetical protein SAMN04515668_1620 [Hymenobacter arizonensis]